MIYDIYRGSKVDMVSGVIQMLICLTINPEKTNRNSGGSVGKSYSHVHEG
jgi:hypothetical protein